jgi:hypothetical protein
VQYRTNLHQLSTTATVQTALGLASMVPGLGTVAGIINAGIDLAMGDPAGAAVSLASAVPFIGLELGALKAGTVVASSAARGAVAAKETSYLYRGVSAGHPAIDAARQGRVIPGNLNGTVSAEAHNLGGQAANSPFTSWTRDPAIAATHASKNGPGGAVLRVPQGAPSAGATWSWAWSPDVWGESEVLMCGVRNGVEVFK